MQKPKMIKDVCRRLGRRLYYLTETVANCKESFLKLAIGESIGHTVERSQLLTSVCIKGEPRGQIHP